MSASPENSDPVEKLLRLKRYEQPPPRYFKDFSGRVIDRIERGEGRASWWERFGFDLRPALAAGAGLVACGLIVYGVATTEGTAGQMGVAGDGSFQTARVPEPENSISANSTNPVLSPYGTSIDRKAFRDGVVPVGFNLR